MVNFTNIKLIVNLIIKLIVIPKLKYEIFFQPQQNTTSIVQPVKLPPGEPVTTTEAAMREQLLKKQRELIELQKKKIELELLQAKASLEQQQRQLDKQAGTLKTEVVSYIRLTCICNKYTL